MKILHTGDWHLGKRLEGYSRIEEQNRFIDELIEIADREEVEMIVVAGDIFDTPNPPSEAEHLYYRALKELSNGGKRPVVVIAGNHDSPKKIVASEPIAREHGIISFGAPLEEKETGTYGKFQVTESYRGGVVIEVAGEEVFVNALPYPSEKTLNEVWGRDEESSYSQRIGEVLRETHSHKREGLKSIIIAHLFTLGAENEGSERQIELGGSLAFNLGNAPEADYIALGHIHKPMEFKAYNAAYSGSNLEYRVSEAKFNKKILVKDLESGELKKIDITNHKPIKEYTAMDIEDAIGKAEALMEREEWIYLRIETERPLKNSELRRIKANKNIIEIIPNIKWEGQDEEILVEEYSREGIADAFKAFYKKNTNMEADKKTEEIFLRLIGEDE